MRLKFNILCFLLISQKVLFGGTYHVPSDYSTIQTAINGVIHGDTVIVAPGVYEETINFNGKAILVASYFVIDSDSSFIYTTIIDAQDTGSVVTMKSGETNSSILLGFTIQNGNGNYEDPDENGTYYTYGGGLYIQDSDPSIKNCKITNNVGNEGGGGGVFCYNSSPIFLECTFDNNETDDVGGGLYSRSNSSPEFYNCIFSENSAEFGAGCYLRNDSSPIMENVTFESNTASNSGGGFILKDGANLNASDLYVLNNSADGLGAGIYINNSDANLSYVLVGGNSSSSGAGIYVRNSSQVEIENGSISANVATSYGGGIYLRDGVNVTVINSIIYGNSETQIYFRSTGDDVELDISFTNIENGENGIINNDNGDVIWGDGNIEGDPYFCNAPISDFYLRENSPSLTSGSDGSFIGCFAVGCGPVNLGPTWYVDPNGHDGNDGSLETPFATITHAISTASDGDTIRLNPNTYSESFHFDNKEIVLESRAFELNMMELIEETIFIPTENGNSCLTLIGPNNDNAILRGFTFKDATSINGAGVFVENCSPTFENIIVKNNTSELGGGVYLNESNSYFKNCTLKNNGSNLGGGIYILDGSPSFENVTLQENLAYWGGGIYAEDSQANMVGCIFRGNEAFMEGGGLYLEGGLCEIEWSSFEENIGVDFGAGILANMSAVEISQTTFSGNISGVGSCIAFMGSTTFINNSILWDNNSPIFYSMESVGMSSIDISYSDVEGGIPSLEQIPNLLLTVGEGLINNNPEFCDVLQNNYNLNESSICQNASNSGEIIGAFDSSCDETVSIDKSIVVDEFRLDQNYPNPFNPKTTIQFSLKHSGEVSLIVYNLQGQKIKTLKSGSSDFGRFSVEWNGKNDFGAQVPSGLYLVQLVTKNRMLERKMLLLK